MMKALKVLISILLLPLLLVLAACSNVHFSAPQLEMLRSAFQTYELTPEHYWVLRLPRQAIALVPVSDDPSSFISYVNPMGLSLNHNGTELVSVYGWPESRTDIRIDREGDRLIHRLRDGSEVQVRCDEWTQSGSLWTLNCAADEGLAWSYRNEVELDESGRIIRMRYWLWPGLSPAELLWFPVSGENPSILTSVTP